MNDMTLNGVPAGLAQAYRIAQEQGLPINNATIQQVYDSLMRNGTGEQLSTAQHFNNATAQFNDATSTFDRISAMLDGIPGVEQGQEVGTNLANGNGLRTQSSPTTSVQPGHPPWKDSTAIANSQVGSARSGGGDVRANDASVRASMPPMHSESTESRASEPGNDADDVVASTPQQLGTGDTGNPIDAILAAIPALAVARNARTQSPVSGAPMQGGLPTDNVRTGTVVREPRYAAPMQLAAPNKQLPAPSTEDALLSRIPGIDALEAPAQSAQVGATQRAQIPSQVPEMQTATGSVIEAPDPTKLATQHGVPTQRRGNQTQPVRTPSVIEAGPPPVQDFSDKSSYANTPRMQQLRAQADAIRQGLPPVAEGSVRLWRGNRPNELGTASQFTNSLEGIALPFAEQYKGDISYIDVPNAELQNYVQNVGAAQNSEFNLPEQYARNAQPVKAQAASTADSLVDSVAEKTASSDKPKRIQPRDMNGITNKFKVELANNAPDYDQVSVDLATKRGRGGSTELVVKKGAQELGRFKSQSELMNAVKDIAAALKRLR